MMNYETICEKVRTLIEERTREILSDMTEKNYAEAIAEQLMAAEDMEQLVDKAIYDNAVIYMQNQIDVAGIVDEVVDNELDYMI